MKFSDLPEMEKKRQVQNALAHFNVMVSLTTAERERVKSNPRPAQEPLVDQIKGAILNWREHGTPPGIMLIGATGSGKTWIAQKVLYEAARAGLDGCYLDVLLATAEMRGRTADEVNPLAEFTRDALRRAVVVIDDVGAIDGADTRFLVSSVLHAAWRSGAFVLITGNLNPPEFYRWIGGGHTDERVKSKVEPFAKVEFRPKDVPDYRKTPDHKPKETP